MKTYSVSLVACDNISAFHLAVPCLVFQDAFIGLEPVFKLNVCSENSMAVELSSGFSVPICHDLSNIDDADIVVVPSWPNTLPEPSDQLLEKLRKAYQRNATIVGLCLGSYVVAKLDYSMERRQRPIGNLTSLFKTNSPMLRSTVDTYLSNKIGSLPQRVLLHHWIAVFI